MLLVKVLEIFIPLQRSTAHDPSKPFYQLPLLCIASSSITAGFEAVRRLLIVETPGFGGAAPTRRLFRGVTVDCAK
jgi:hypothetical protein